MKRLIFGALFSKTMWAGALIMLANYLNNNIEMFQNMVPTQYHDLVLYGIGILVWMLRLVTDESVSDKAPVKKHELSKSEKALADAYKEDEEYIKDF